MLCERRRLIQVTSEDPSDGGTNERIPRVLRALQICNTRARSCARRLLVPLAACQPGHRQGSAPATSHQPLTTNHYLMRLTSHFAHVARHRVARQATAQLSDQAVPDRFGDLKVRRPAHAVELMQVVRKHA